MHCKVRFRGQSGHSFVPQGISHTPETFYKICEGGSRACGQLNFGGATPHAVMRESSPSPSNKDLIELELQA